MTPHIINSGKYFSSILIQLCNIFKDKGDTQFTIFVTVSILSTLYCYAWDLYMDWGLLRSKEPGRRFLRPKTMYPVGFYYYAMISNFFLRFFWVLSLLPASDFDQWFNEAQGMLFILTVAEGFRRTQWALIRIENENINNFEKYRTILQIPAMKEDQEEIEEFTEK